MKLSQKVQMDTPIHLTPTPGQSETLMSSKTPGRDFEDMHILDMVQESHCPPRIEG